MDSQYYEIYTERTSSMIFSRKNKNECSLLPFIREDIWGLDPKNGQFYGWEISKFNIPKLWEKTKGENIKVAVIDTGCDFNHHDLKDNIIQGVNFVNPGKEPMDRNGHGTHVAGTIAASDNNLGMVGIAPRAKIMPIKSLDDRGGGNLINVCKGIEWATDNGADVITMSLGAVYGDNKLQKAIAYAHKNNVLIFCAAGNSGENSPIMYPAKYPETIAIGAIDMYLNRTKFTCVGEELDFLCPGQDILSCVPNNSYAKMSGTSMSNPFAAGYAALILSLNNRRISREDCINIIRRSVIDIGDLKYRSKKYQGYGIIIPKI